MRRVGLEIRGINANEKKGVEILELVYDDCT